MDAYLEEFMSEDRDAVAIRNECNKHLQAQIEIEEAIPNSVVIGLFHLNTAACRDMLVKKCKDMSKVLLQHLGQTLRKAADVVMHGYVLLTCKGYAPHARILWRKGRPGQHADPFPCLADTTTLLTVYDPRWMASRRLMRN
jgi:hypothetical protein